VSLYPPRLQLATFLQASGTFHVEKLIEMFKVYKAIESPSSILKMQLKLNIAYIQRIPFGVGPTAMHGTVQKTPRRNVIFLYQGFW
jgi:hypothetical protein